MSRDAFVGTWRLVSCTWVGADGDITYPYGRSPVGYLIYTEDGHMAVNFMNRNRRRFASDHVWGSSPEEERSAKKTYQSYSGTYEVRDHVMIHHVEVSLFPNWVGRAQERFYELNGDRLCLSTKPLRYRGSHQTAYLEWERVAPQAGDQADGARLGADVG